MRPPVCSTVIVATIAALAAAAVQPVLTGTNYLTGVANQPNRLAAAAVLCLIAAGTSVGIAIALYPLLKEVNAALAMGQLYSEPSKRSSTRSRSCACFRSCP